MRKLAVAFLFCLTSTIANAQSFQLNHKLYCDKAKEIFRALFEQGEKPLWQGKNEKGFVTVLMLNAQTQSWTLVMTDGETACALDFGKGFTVGSGQEKKTPQRDFEKKSNPRELTDAQNKYKL